MNTNNASPKKIIGGGLTGKPASSKILSLIVALAMIVAVVPAFGLVASAAETNYVINATDDAVVLFSMPDSASSLSDFGWGTSGISSNTAVDVDGTIIRVKNSSTGANWGMNGTITTPGYAAGAQTFIFEALYARSWGVGSALYLHWTFKDIDGNTIANPMTDRNAESVDATHPWGFPGFTSTETKNRIALKVENNWEEGTHTNTYYVNGSVTITETLSGTVNGLGSIYFYGGESGTSDGVRYQGFSNITVAAVQKATSVTVNFKDGSGNTIKEPENYSSDLYVGYKYKYDINKQITGEDGQTYVYTGTDDTKDMVLEDTNTIDLVYTQDSIKAQNDSIEVTTRIGVAPNLPTTVNAQTEAGNVILAPVDAWTVGDISAVGTAIATTKFTGTDIAVTANVTVKDKNDYIVVDYGFEGNGDSNVNNDKYAATVGSDITYVDGVIGQCVSFPGPYDGTSASGTNNPGNAIKLGGAVFTDDAFLESKSATISMFVQPLGGLPKQYSRFFDFGSKEDGNDIFYTPENGNYVGNLFYQGNYGQVTPAYNTAVVGEWTHIAVTFEYVSDSEWTVSIWKNGELARNTKGNSDQGPAVGTFTKAFYEVTGNYFLGASNWDDPLYQGLMDEFKIYSVALTADEIASIAAIAEPVKKEVTVNYVDTDGNTLSESTTEQYTEGTQYGYDNEVIFPNVEIPYFEGYVLKSKSVSEETVTLTYEAVQDDAFFDNVDKASTPVISLNMLGAHDAFTSELDGTRGDAAQAALDNDTATLNVSNASYLAYLGRDTNITKTQTLDVLDLLHAGVRYFDIRVSRSTDEYSYLTTTIPATNGVFYTSHNSLSSEFRTIAYTLGQWAKQHPGEVIILDFQNLADNGAKATTTSWTDLYAILKEAGLGDYAVIKDSNAGSGNLAGATINQLTENGAHAGVLLLSQQTGRNVGNFIARQAGDLFSGRLYSNYDTNVSIGTSFDEAYIQGQVDYADTFSNNAAANDHIFSWMLRVMQAQSENKSNLLTQAATDNTKLYNALTSGEHPTWLTALPIVMVNGVGSNTDSLVSLFKARNAATATTVNYTLNGETVATASKDLMVGTLYTATGGEFITAEDGTVYFTNKTYATKPANGEIEPVPYGAALEIPVTAFVGNNVFTWQAGHINTGNLDDAGVYPAASNFGAFNWGTTATTHDRVGVAVLNAPSADADAYYLEGTQARYYGSLTAKLYAVSYEDYLAVDLTDTSALISLLTSDRLAATITSGTQGAAVKVELDAAVVKNAVGGSGKIVVLGDAYNGLYGLAAEGLAITSVSLDDVTVKLISGGATVGTYGTKTDADGNVTVPAGIYSGNDSNRYYLFADKTVTPGEDGTYSVEVDLLGNVWTWREGRVNNYTTTPGNEGYLTDDGIYTSETDFGAFNWGEDGTYDRLGIAVLEVLDVSADAYALEGTQVRFGNNAASTSDVNLKLYVISYDAYKAVDLTDTAAVTALLADENLAATINGSTLNSDNNGAVVSFELDKEKVVAAAGEVGKVVIIGNVNNALYGLAGEGLTIVATTVPTLTPALGWNADTSEFTIDFLFNNGVVGNTYTITVIGQNDTADGAVIGTREVTISDTIKGLPLNTENTNRLYKAYASVGAINGEATAPVSVYSLVANALNSGGFGEENRIVSTQVDAVNKVLASGGIYFKNGELTDETALLMDYNSTAGTITIKENLFAAGLKFTDISSSDGSTTTACTVSEDGKTVTLSKADVEAAEAEFFELEDVELVLVPEVIEESTADEQVEIVLDFEEIL